MPTADWQRHIGYAPFYDQRSGFAPTTRQPRRDFHNDELGYDRDYESWRRSRMDELDRDYHEYRSENRDRFHQEFGTWRQRRDQQRGCLTQVRKHMDVVGSDGEHVGTIDKCAGDRIILTKSDPDAGGHHHSIPSRWIDGVENDVVKLEKTAAQAQQAWRDEERNRRSAIPAPATISRII